MVLCAEQLRVCSLKESRSKLPGCMKGFAWVYQRRLRLHLRGIVCIGLLGQGVPERKNPFPLKSVINFQSQDEQVLISGKLRVTVQTYDTNCN